MKEYKVLTQKDRFFAALVLPWCMAPGSGSH